MTPLGFWPFWSPKVRGFPTPRWRPTTKLHPDPSPVPPHVPRPPSTSPRSPTGKLSEPDLAFYGGLITEARWLGSIRSRWPHYRGALAGLHQEPWRLLIQTLAPPLPRSGGGGRVPLATSQYPSGLSESHLININPAVGERGFFRGTGTRLSFAVLEPFRELGAKDAPRAPGWRRPSEHERGPRTPLISVASPPSGSLEEFVWNRHRFPLNVRWHLPARPSGPDCFFAGRF